MLMRMKENYYIKKCCGDFVLLKRRKNQEKCKKVLERVGVYGTLKETKEAIIKEMIKDEVNHRKTEPLYKLIPLMRQMYDRFYEENIQQRKQKVYGVPSAFSCFSSKKILSSIGKKDAIKKNDKYFEKIKNVVKTTDFLRSIDYTDDTVKDKKSRKGE